MAAIGKDQEVETGMIIRRGMIGIKSTIIVVIEISIGGTIGSDDYDSTVTITLRIETYYHILINSLPINILTTITL